MIKENNCLSLIIAKSLFLLISFDLSLEWFYKVVHKEKIKRRKTTLITKEKNL